MLRPDAEASAKTGALPGAPFADPSPSQGSGTEDSPKSPIPVSRVRRFLASGAFRFAGWWSIFAGALALNSTCPVCGGASCPVGIGTTGAIAAALAGVKQWGSPVFRYIRGLFGATNTSDEKSGATGDCRGGHCGEHRHHTR